MQKKEFYMPRKLTLQLLHQAQLSPDKEICGLIGGQNNIAHSGYPVDNVSNTPETRFLLDPKQQIASMADMRERKESLWAVYHSHPTSPAQPSIADLVELTYPEALLLIISLNTKGVLEIRGFQYVNGSVQEINLCMLE